jgi:hypothetical protein
LVPLLGGDQRLEVLGEELECGVLQGFFIQTSSIVPDLDAVVRCQLAGKLFFTKVGQTLDGVHVGKAKQVGRTLLVFRQFGEVHEVDHVRDGLPVEVLDLERVVLVLAPFFGRKHRFPDFRLVGQDALVTGEGLVLADDLEIGEILVEHHFLQRFLTNFRSGSLHLLHRQQGHGTADEKFVGGGYFVFGEFGESLPVSLVEEVKFVHNVEVGVVVSIRDYELDLKITILIIFRYINKPFALTLLYLN